MSSRCKNLAGKAGIQLRYTTTGQSKERARRKRLVETMVSQTLFIGTVLATGPVYHHNTLKNVTEFKTHSYEYYWNYPYRGPQWYLDN